MNCKTYVAHALYGIEMATYANELRERLIKNVTRGKICLKKKSNCSPLFLHSNIAFLLRLASLYINKPKRLRKWPSQWLMFCQSFWFKLIAWFDFVSIYWPHNYFAKYIWITAQVFLIYDRNSWRDDHSFHRTRFYECQQCSISEIPV